MAAARELTVTMRMAEQFKTLLPIFMQTAKSNIVRNRPEVEKDFDALMPLLLAAASARSSELVDAIAVSYANVLTVSEMREINAFYKSAVGQTLITKMPALTQQSVAAGQAWGRSIATGLRDKMIEELRKRGHTI